MTVPRETQNSVFVHGHRTPARDFLTESVQGSLVTLLAQSAIFILHFLSVVVLARLLTPEDYGLFSIAMALIVFLSLFKGLGLSFATVQKTEITHDQLSVLFWINMALGIGLGLLMIIASRLLAWLYSDMRLFTMSLALSVIFILNGTIDQSRAVLSREMRFTSLALIDIFSMFIGVISAIIGALAGFGYWALVMMHVSLASCTAISVWIVSDWKPSRPANKTPVSELIGFGSHVTGAHLCAYLSRNSDTYLIGWRYGAFELGLYDRAYQLILLPMLQIIRPLSSIIFPILSRLTNDPSRYREVFNGILLLSTGLAMPLISFLWVTAEKAVMIILGNQWLGSIPIFRALSIAAFIDPLFICANWLFLSLGQTKRMFQAMSVVACFTIICFLIGLPFGAKGVAFAFSVSRILLLVPLLRFAARYSPVKWITMIQTVIRPAIASLAAAAGLIVFGNLMLPFKTPFFNLFFHALFFLILYFLGLMSLPGGKAMLGKGIRLVKNVILTSECR